MANSPQAIKRARQAEKRRLHNTSLRSDMRTATKQITTKAKGESQEALKAAYQQASTKIDKIAGKGLIHKNKAARIKSRLNRYIKNLGK